jgi:alpha-ketoglutarate-dependent taurine dioxygenase
MALAPLFEQPHHPLVFTPDGDDASGVALQDQLERDPGAMNALLHRHGAILLRGWSLSGAADFEAIVSRLGGRPWGYVGGNSPRTRVLQDVYTSTDYPATEVISPHNELSYLQAWPARLFFFSEVPAASGGQTPLVHGADVLRAMPGDIVARLRERKVRYVRHFNPKLKMGKTWQATYRTEDRDELTAILGAQGSQARWSDGDVLHVTTVCEPFAVHPVTGEEVWFNQAEQWHPSALAPALRRLLEPRGQLAHDCEFGDGGPMDDEMLATIRRVIDARKLMFDWRRGDLLMLDNVLMLHGREAFTGARTTYAYLSGS